MKTEHLVAQQSAAQAPAGLDLLIIDEIGNTVLDRQEGNKLFQPIWTYQQTSLIVISNKGFDDAQTLGDNVVTAAVMDRLMHKCEMFNIGGDSWRLENQQSILRDLHDQPEIPKKRGRKHDTH